jgi:branched-subunit amino acid ABC-type transport system permease component
MSVDVAMQALLAGLAVGSAYGLIALGFTLVHRLTGVLALAHGDMIVGAVFLAVLVVVGTTPTAAAVGLPGAIGIIGLVLIFGAAIAGGAYLSLIRPFLPRVGSAAGDATGWLAGSLAVGLMVRELLGLVFTQQAYALPDPLRAFAASSVIRLHSGLVFSSRAIEVIAIGLIAGIAVDLFLARTGVGVTMKAVSEDATAAGLLGVPVERLVLTAFLIAGALAGVAGVLIAPDRALALDDGVILGLKGIAGAFLFRLGSLRGALLGGLVIGVVESFVIASSLGPRYADVVPLTVLVAVLAIRPAGLRAAVPREVE